MWIILRLPGFLEEPDNTWKRETGTPHFEWSHNKTSITLPQLLIYLISATLLYKNNLKH